MQFIIKISHIINLILCIGILSEFYRSILSGLQGHIGLQDCEEEGTKFLQDWVGGTLRTGTILMVRHGPSF